MAHTDIATIEGRTIRKLHSPDGKKIFGYLSGIKDDAGNLSETVAHTSEIVARLECGAYWPNYKNVDRIRGYVIRKIFMNDNHFLGYLSGQERDDKTLYEVKYHATLADARDRCGFINAPAPQDLTKPKSDYKQNQKGYKASPGSRKG